MRKRKPRKPPPDRAPEPRPPRDGDPVDGECEVCGATPIIEETGLCGPCTFGEAETAGGNW